MAASNVQCLDSRAFYLPGQEVINPLSQYNWSDTDFASTENLNFDVDLDESEFEKLFRNIEASPPIYWGDDIEAEYGPHFPSSTSRLYDWYVSWNELVEPTNERLEV